MSTWTTHPRWLLALIPLGVATTLVCTGRTAPDPAAASRYPYDPACAWGRLSDGRGLLVRCLTQQEAASLTAPPSSTGLPAPTASQAPPTVSSAAAPPPAGSSAPSAPPPVPPAEPTTTPLALELSPATADTGSLPDAHKNLAAARPRLLACVRDNGGLTGATGEIEVRFLVRERGIAEGVSVAKRSGVSKRAAQCIADVIDRRRVGVPDAPMVGASMVLRYTGASR